MDQWSDATKFWAESMRTVVFGIMGAIAATVVLGRYADSDKTLRDIRAQAIERFLINSNEYSAAAYDLCKNGGEGALMRLQSTIAGYHGSREMLTVYFDDDQFRSIAQNTENEEDELYNVCKNGHVPQEQWVTLRNDFKAANLNLAKTAVKRNKAF